MVVTMVRVLCLGGVGVMRRSSLVCPHPRRVLSVTSFS